MATYRIHTVQVHVDGSSAVNIPDILSYGLDSAPEIEAAVPAGEISPTFQAYLASNFTGVFDSLAIKTILDELGMSGICIKTDTTGVGVTYFAQQYDDCGDPVAGSVHRSINIASGHIYPQQIQIDHRGNARLTVGVAILSKDQGNDVLTIIDTAALPTITLGSSARWTLGKITIAGTVITKFRSVTIDFGNTITTGGVESNIDDDLVEVKTHEPVIRISGIDPTILQNATPSGVIHQRGTAIAHADTKVYLRKRAEGGAGDGFVQDATAEHLSFTMAGLANITQPFAGDGRTPIEQNFELRGKIDSSGNVPLIYNGATAIT